MSTTFAAARTEVMDERTCRVLEVPVGSTCTALLDGNQGPSLSLSASAELIFRALNQVPAAVYEGGEVSAVVAVSAFDDVLSGPGAWLLNGRDRSILEDAREIAEWAVYRGHEWFAWV